MEAAAYTESVTALNPKRRGPLTWLLDLFSSVWFGIVLMVLIFIYMTVGSAGIVYPTSLNIFSTQNWAYDIPRTWSWVDKTEMEFFAWWPFNTLIAFFVLNMTVVTVRRIPLTVLNSGVWCIHGGIVILALSSVYYFGTKLEGDTPVFRRHILINAPGAESPVRMVVRPDNVASIDSSNGRYQFRITDINPSWPILTGDDKGKTACSVNVAVESPTKSFIRQLLMGYPQYTEDIIPRQGRAVKILGTKLIDSDLSMSMELEPQTEFFLADTAALWVREVGDTDWIERPIEGLPHFSDHIASTREIWQPRGDPPIQPNPLNITLPTVHEQDPLAGLTVRVVGRLRYSPQDETRAIPGGPRLNPVIGVRLESGQTRRDFDLAALNPASRDAEGMLGFRWAQNDVEFEKWANQVKGNLTITIPAADATVTTAVTETLASDPDLGFTPIADSGWSYRIRGAEQNLRINEQSTISVVIVELKNADRTITRWVADRPFATRDVSEDRGMVAPATEVVTSYEPPVPLMIIGGPDERSLTLVANDPNQRQPLKLNQPVSLGNESHDLKLTTTYVLPRAQFDRRPVVTPMRLRQPGAKDQFSRIKVSLEQSIGSDNPWSHEMWLFYHRYPLRSEQYAVPRRFMYNPMRVTLPSGKQVELMFSRQRWPLPAAIALEDFQLKTHVGGFTGQTTSIRDFVSRLRAYDGNSWSEPFTASLNNPASLSGMYFFQSEWDPQNMAFTGLGVGNRNGVLAQLLGTCLSVAGMIFVFYVKPIIKRRRRMAVWATVQKQRSESAELATQAV